MKKILKFAFIFFVLLIITFSFSKSVFAVEFNNVQVIAQLSPEEASEYTTLYNKTNRTQKENRRLNTLMKKKDKLSDDEQKVKKSLQNTDVTIDMFDDAGNADDITTPTQAVLATIINVIRIVGTGVSIIMMTYVAIKYMSAAPSEKAEFKKSATAMIVGAIVLFATTNILKIISNFATTNI